MRACLICTGGSRVVEFCSTAAFQPLPGLGVYAATKAFLQSYTKTLHYELRPGIHVTAVSLLGSQGYGVHPFGQGGKARAVPSLSLASRSRSVVTLSRAASAELWVATPPGIVQDFPSRGGKGDPPRAAGPADGAVSAGYNRRQHPKANKQHIKRSPEKTGLRLFSLPKEMSKKVLTFQNRFDKIKMSKVFYILKFD